MTINIINQPFLKADELNRLTDRKHKFWQTGYSPKQILNIEMMQQKTDYIHYNPVRKKYVKETEEWLFSSARNFGGLTSPLGIDEIVI